jgi:hypothetical protein
MIMIDVGADTCLEMQETHWFEIVCLCSILRYGENGYIAGSLGWKSGHPAGYCNQRDVR